MKTVLCYGDSNTHGTLPMAHLQDRRRLARAERWPGVLRGHLGPDWDVIEEGLPGRTTLHDDPVEGAWKNGLALLQATLETHFPVDLVVLLLGTNDLKPRFAVPAFDIAKSAEKLVLAVRASACGPASSAPAVLLVAPPPIIETGCLGPMFAGGAAKSAELGALYADVARRTASAFVDAGQVIASDPAEGIHFGADQHALLAAAIATRIAAM